MSNFLSYFQPTIVKFANDSCIPKSLQGHYALNINAMGIDWFKENFILYELDNGQTLLGVKDGIEFNLLLEDSGANKFDIPRMYIVLDEKYSEDKLGEFVIKVLSNSEMYGDGIKEFRPGYQYYVNETLYGYLRAKTDHNGQLKTPIISENLDIVLPNYLVESSDSCKISDYFEELSDSEKKSNNISWFVKKNALAELAYSESELKDFTTTFCKIILNNTEINSEDKITSTNQIYKKVLEYWSNGGYDEAAIALQQILSTKSKTTPEYTTATCNSCYNTTSTSSSSSIDTTSCYDLYIEAMKQWLQDMLASTDFYNDWFMVTEDDEKSPNDSLIDAEINLIQSLLDSGLTIGTSDTSTTKTSCGCPSLDSSYSDDSCNRNILMNYIKVLQWVKSCQISANKNKIKVYGGEFGELLTKIKI